MPGAQAGYAAPTARVPREIFEHAHKNVPAAFPEVLVNFGNCDIIFKIPDNWNGIDSLELIVVPSIDEASFTTTIIIDGGTDTEAVNTHTQTVNPFNFAATANVFNYVDLTAAFAVILALLTGGDTIKINVTSFENANLIVYGAFLKET